jgi:hypothetical protein
MRPWPQPKSRRSSEGPLWYPRTVLKTVGGYDGRNAAYDKALKPALLGKCQCSRIKKKDAGMVYAKVAMGYIYFLVPCSNLAGRSVQYRPTFGERFRKGLL